jgi:integrase
MADRLRPAGAATRSSYRYALKRFRADWGGTRLADVGRPEARAWALSQPQSNVRVARTMFSDAINDGLHPGPNPFAGLRLEQPRGRKDLDALTEVEVHRLADCAFAVHGSYGQTFRAMILFAAYVGLRPGELFAFERGDLDGDLVRIRRSLDGTGQVKLPKNNKERIVILPPPAREALREMPARADVPWVFTSPRGRRFSQGSLTYCWRPVRAAFGRPEMDFYELRHFCATHLLELGVSHADVAVQLGHRDGGRLVMSTYGHPSEEGARERLKRATRATSHRFARPAMGRNQGAISDERRPVEPPFAVLVAFASIISLNQALFGPKSIGITLHPIAYARPAVRPRFQALDRDDPNRPCLRTYRDPDTTPRLLPRGSCCGAGSLAKLLL